MASDSAEQTFDVPKKCKAGVVVNEGPDFRVEVQEVDVPEIGLSSLPAHLASQKDPKIANT